METYYKHISFEIKPAIDNRKKIMDYFTLNGFNIIEENFEKIVFNKKDSFLSSWHFNPLKWGSNVVINLFKNSIEAHFSLDLTNINNPKQEIAVWHIFLQNFQHTLQGKEINTTELNFAINQSKKTGWSNFFKFIFIYAVCGLIGFYISKSFGLKYPLFFSMPLIIILTAIFNKKRIEKQLKAFT
jgi:hypothetical protein